MKIQSIFLLFFPVCDGKRQKNCLKKSPENVHQNSNNPFPSLFNDFFIQPSFPSSRGCTTFLSFAMWGATVLVEWFSPEYYLNLMPQIEMGYQVQMQYMKAATEGHHETQQQYYVVLMFSGQGGSDWEYGYRQACPCMGGCMGGAWLPGLVRLDLSIGGGLVGDDEEVAGVGS